MNKKGGYQVINLKDFNFTKEKGTFIIDVLNDNIIDYEKFIYNLILAKNSKAILLSNIVIDGVEKNDVWLSYEDLTDITPTNIKFKVYNHESYIQLEDNTLYFTIVV